MSRLIPKKTEDWLHIFEIVSIMFGGIWTGYMYFKFDETDRQLTQQTQRYEEIIKKNELHSKNIDVECNIKITELKHNKKQLIVNFNYHLNPASHYFILFNNVINQWYNMNTR